MSLATPIRTSPSKPPGRLPGKSRLLGKVVLVDANDPQLGSARVLRYALEGADLAVCHRVPIEELFAIQQQVEASGVRCVLYELDLDDEWNCGLVVQSVTECLGPIDLVVDVKGHVTSLSSHEAQDARVLLQLLGGENRELRRAVA